MSRLLRPHRLAYVGVYLALSVAFCWPLLVRPYANGTGDWDQHTFYYASVLRSLAAGQLPFWNPWYCGGNVLWQNPQVSLISPIYVLALVMPLTLAMKVNVVGHYLVGCLGMHLLARRIFGVRSPFVVVYLVSLAVFAGGMALHVMAGHTNYLSMFWLPALTYCFFRAADGGTKHLLAGAGIIGVMILNGGPHVVPMAAVVLGTLGVGAIAIGRTVKPLVIAVAVVAAGCLYAAPKLVPTAFFTASPDFHDRRPVKQPDAMSIEMIRRSLWDQSQDTSLKVTPGVQLYGWHEYGNYMGWFGASASLVAGAWILAFRWRRPEWREWAVGVGLAVVVVVAAGEFAAWAPARWLRRLPLFSSFRIPSRFILLAPLLGAACLASAASAFENLRKLRWVLRIAEMLCVAGVCQIVLVNRAHFRDVFILPPDVIEARNLDMSPPTVAEHEPPSAAMTRMGETSTMVRTMIAGVSALNCWEPLPVRRIAQPGPEVISGTGPIAFQASNFSPNRVAATVIVGNEPVRIVLNQNFAEGWSSNAGPVEREPGGGRPSVVLPSGYRGTVVFRFAPPGLWVGLAIWALAIALSIVLWRRRGVVDRLLRTAV